MASMNPGNSWQASQEGLLVKAQTAFLVLVIFLISGAFLTVPLSAHAANCGASALSAGGYFFTNYENVEYSPDGRLVHHFKISPSWADGRPFRFSWSYYDDECNPDGSLGFSKTISLPAGVTDWSVRFVSASHADIWNDQANAIVSSIDFPERPSYTRAVFSGGIDGSASTFNSRTLQINQDSQAPTFTDSLPLPESCSSTLAGSAGGSSPYFFDTYEHAEFVDGLLRVHLRLKSPYNDGRPFRSAVTTAGNDCSFTFPFLSSNNTSLPAYVRYFSFRMTSDTHWEIWNDETDQPVSCTSCSGDLPVDSKYVVWLASIDGGASTIKTTPFSPVESVKIDPVIVVPGILGSMEKNGVWVLDPVLHVYDNLVETLDANNYTLGVDLFTFPYDWTKSNTETAIALKTKIDEVKSICGCGKVDIVAHSMGGLVARQYVQSPSYENDIDQLIFLGTPHMGAPKAYLMYEGGESGPGIQNALTYLFLSHLAHEAGYENTFDYIRLNPIPSVRELLPVYSYLFDTSNSLQQYPNGSPTNPFLENLSNTLSLLTNSGVEVTNVIGEDQTNDTINSITVESSTMLPLWQHGVPVALNDGQGDGTVPYFSANSIGSFVSLNSSHSKLPSLAESLVYETLVGTPPEILINDNLFENALVVRAFSPIDFQVIAPDGKRVGKDFGSLNSEINEIPGAFYSGSNTDAEFVVIPSPVSGEYKVITEGTGTGGAYSVSAAYLTERETNLTEFTGTAFPAVQEEKDIFLDSDNPNPVSVVDSVPPVITIASPEDGSVLLHSDKLILNIDVQDSDSGVAGVETYFDDEVVEGNALDLFYKSLGQHVIRVNAHDVVGNATSTSHSVQIVATFESTVSDVERAYDLGWVVKKNTKNSILNKLERAVKISKRIEFLEEKLPGKPKVIKRIEKLEKRLDRVLGEKIVEDLEKEYSKGLVTEQGYRVIKADVEWLSGLP